MSQVSGLLRRAATLAPRMDAAQVAATLNAVATLRLPAEKELLEALLARAWSWSGVMVANDVARTLRALPRLPEPSLNPSVVNCGVAKVTREVQT